MLQDRLETGEIVTDLPEIMTHTINEITTINSYNMTNSELTGFTGPATTSYGYDWNGNLASKNVASNQWTYAWDVPGDLLNVANNSGVQGYYAYDGLGRRIESKEGSSTIFYGYLGTETLAEGVTNPYTDYIYANSLRIARVTGAYPGGNPAIVYFHTDALGSTRLITDANKYVLFTDNYQPYGQDSQSSGSETYKFTGKSISAATGLYYEYSRWYDPTVGRFISPDQVAGQGSNPQSLNPYSYTLNSPLNYFDPNGAGPVEIVWKTLTMLAALFVTGEVLDLRFRIGQIVHFQTLPSPYEGDTYHTLFTMYRPKIIGKRDTVPLLKIDMPSANLNAPAEEQGFHIKIGRSRPQPFPDSLGDLGEFVLFHADRGLLIAGIAFSGYRIWSAYQADAARGDGYDNTILTTEEEAFSWGGATAGCYLGATLGSVVPGAGTAVGCLVGGMLGGIYGEQAIQTLAQPHWSYAGTDPPMVFRTRFGRAIGWE